ncbi:hypothetical protein BJY00DRAFT_302821 [Aspergillus carlsbadensis]|nr:hypothetical protein BJY00DRAFT_302821 [Aspergillus carlsbadensis]
MRYGLAAKLEVQPVSNISLLIVSFLFRDGLVNSVSIRDKGQVIDTRRKFMVDSWVRQIKHNNIFDEGTYLPGRLFVPSSGCPNLKLINKSVLLSRTDIIYVAGWMKDWRIPYMQGQAGILAKIVYLQQRPFN